MPGAAGPLLCGTARLTRDQSLRLLWGNLALPRASGVDLYTATVYVDIVEELSQT